MQPTEPNNQNSVAQPGYTPTTAPQPQPIPAQTAPLAPPMQQAQAQQPLPPQPAPQSYAPQKQPYQTAPQARLSWPAKKPVTAIVLAASGVVVSIIGQLVSRSDDSSGSSLSVTGTDVIGDIFNFVGISLILAGILKFKKYLDEAKNINQR